ncbi:response regulator [soil metagenome]
MTKRILFVDDEPNVLSGIQRTLRRDFDIETAESGQEALARIMSEGPFAVIVSDMRMPGMDGVHLLARVKEIAPQTVRIMLTGNAEQQTAIDAVNEGSIFRFLNKPCTPEALVGTLNAGLEQYRLITAEEQLLERTLNESLHVLVDILAITNPTAFSRSSRVKKLAGQIAENLKLKNSWEIEVAAMLSQVGCVSVPEEILQKVVNGRALSDKETGLYHRHPQVAHDLISRIPRMESVAEIVANQNGRITDEPILTLNDDVDEQTLGARILKVVLDFDRLITGGNSPRSAFKDLSDRAGWYDPRVLFALQTVIEISVGKFESVDLSVSDLKPGMFLDGTLSSVRGSLLLPDGQEITISLILRLINMIEAGIITDSIRVLVPVDFIRAKEVYQAA